MKVRTPYSIEKTGFTECLLYDKQGRIEQALKQGHMNNYQRDLLIEQVTGRFLDSHLYNTYNPKTGEELFCKNERISDKEEQFKGVDIIISSFPLHIKQAMTDEKGQAHRYFPTFAFELSYVMYEDKQEIDRLSKSHTINSWIEEQNRHVHYVHEGWLTDENKISEFYLLIWYIRVNDIDCINSDRIPWKESGNTINEIECALIKRDDIREIIKSNGYTPEMLKEKEKEIRSSRLKGTHERFDINGNKNRIWFSFTDHLPETPINVVIPKSELFYWAKATFKVSERGIEEINIR